MAKPQVTCSADVVIDYDGSPRLVSLGATAAPGPITTWRWTILSVPPGSTAHVGTKGDFVDGVATIQTPQLEIDAGIDGGYTIQCVATNADGDSDPFVDRRDGQQAIIVRTQGGQLWLPGDYLYDWGERYLNKTLRLIESQLLAASLQPFWTWNGVDFTEFTIVAGAGVAGGLSPSVVSIGDTPYMWLGLSGNGSGSDLRDWTTLLLATGATPPSADYFVVADIVVPGSYTGFACLGARCSMPTTYPNGFLGLLSPVWAGVSAFQAYRFDDNALYPLSAQPLDELLTAPEYSQVGMRCMAGAKGQSILDSSIVIHTCARSHMLDLNPDKSIPGFAADHPAIGIGVTDPNGYAAFAIGNIRAYEFPPAGKLFSAGDWF